MKNGYKTTEFWFTVISSLVGVAVAVGLLTPEEGEAAGGSLQLIVRGIFGLMPIVLGVVYTLSRTRLKINYKV